MNRGGVYLALAILAAMIVYFGHHRHVRAHEAPSGWAYPSQCCGGLHCKPVDCDALSETKDGIRYLNMLFNSKAIYPSGDHQCHVCIEDYGGGPVPRCVFIVPGA